MRGRWSVKATESRKIWFQRCSKSATANGAASASIPKSGYELRYEFRDHDAERLFEVEEIDTKEPAICISGQMLKGIKKPHDCPAFGTLCTPQIAARRDYGLRRRRVRGVLRLRAAPESGERSGMLY